MGCVPSKEKVAQSDNLTPAPAFTGKERKSKKSKAINSASPALKESGIVAPWTDGHQKIVVEKGPGGHVQIRGPS